METAPEPLREQYRTLVANEWAYVGTRFAFHTCMSQGCITAWLQTSRRHRRQQCQSVACARARGERRRSAIIPAEGCLWCLAQGPRFRFLRLNFANRWYQTLPPPHPDAFNTGPMTYFGALRQCCQITGNTSSQLAMYDKSILLLVSHEQRKPRQESRQNRHLLPKKPRRMQ